MEERVTVLRWQSAMQLGIPALDADHKKLVGLLNTLHYAVIAGGDWDSIGRLLDDLIDYTQTHFAREEALMERTGYPDLQRHRDAHERLARKMQEYYATFIEDPEAFEMDAFYDFVSDWLLHHVLGDDMKLKPYAAKAEARVCA